MRSETLCWCLFGVMFLCTLTVYFFFKSSCLPFLESFWEWNECLFHGDKKRFPVFRWSRDGWAADWLKRRLLGKRQQPIGRRTSEGSLKLWLESARVLSVHLRNPVHYTCPAAQCFWGFRFLLGVSFHFLVRWKQWEREGNNVHETFENSCSRKEANQYKIQR